MMVKRVFLLLMVFIVGVQGSLNAQTRYYKLIKKVIKDVPSTNVSGGQFITFISDRCYESDKEGYSVNGSTLKYKYTEDGILVYSGKCYWGNGVFKFNNDKSRLNVVTNSGDIYVYAIAVPPPSQTTCSLIRTGESNGNSGGTYVDVPNWNINQNSTINQGGNSTNHSNPERTPQKRWHNVTKTVDCNLCHRSGRCQTCNGKGWYQGIYGPIDCTNCYGYKTGKCSHCQGNGTVQKIEQVFD